MTKIDKRIEIVSTTHKGLSSMNQMSRDAAHTVLSMYYDQVKTTIINNLADLKALVARQPDLVFLGMDFIVDNSSDYNPHDSSKIWLADYFDQYNIAYTGSTRKSHEAEYDKPTAKRCVIDAGLATPSFLVAKQNKSLAKNQITLKYPLFVKPTNRGGGIGIDSDSIVYDFDQLKSKVQSIAKNLQADSLVEEYAPGREFSVAILKDEASAELMAMPIELIAQPDENGSRILSKHIKSSNTERAVKVVDGTIKNRVITLATNVFCALGARDYGRIDIRLDKNDEPQFLEANLIPSLISGYGSFPKACHLNMGMSYESMILHIVRLGLSRNLDSDPRSGVATKPDLAFSNL